MITRRDSQVISFFDDCGFKAARTSTLRELFYPSYSVATTRLKSLVDVRELQRERDGWCNEYVYYRKKPKQLRHAVLLTDFYRELCFVADVKKFKPEPSYENIRPDAVVGFEINGQKRIALIEVKISNNQDEKKYESFNWSSYFPVQPELILITDKSVNITGYHVTIINTEMEGLNCL